MEEIWKDIKGYEGLYKISNYGNIYIVKRNKLKKLTLNQDGYYFVFLSKNDKKKSFLVHRLVAENFLNKNDFKLTNDEIKENININTLTVNHKNENKLDNTVNNLEWCTNKYNVIYSSKNRKNYKKIVNNILEYVKKEKISEKVRKDIIRLINN